MDTKNLYIITTLSVLLVIAVVTIILAINVINDLRATANGYKSDRDICRMDHKELIKNYYELEDECCK